MVILATVVAGVSGWIAATAIAAHCNWLGDQLAAAHGLPIARRSLTMDRIRKLLQFLRIADEQGNLSLTNVGVYAALLNLYFGPGASDAVMAAGGSILDALQHLGPLALALWNYGHKRSVASRGIAVEQTAAMRGVLETLERNAQRRAAATSGQPGQP